MDFINRKGYYIDGRDVPSNILDGIFGDVKQQQDVLAVGVSNSPDVIYEIEKQYKQTMGVDFGSKQNESGTEFARRQHES